jgi:hypothetical protein
LTARYSRHLEIDEKHIRACSLVRGEQFQGGSGVVGAKHLVALVGEQQRHELKAYSVVIHHKNFVPGIDSASWPLPFAA